MKSLKFYLGDEIRNPENLVNMASNRWRLFRKLQWQEMTGNDVNCFVKVIP